MTPAIEEITHPVVEQAGIKLYMARIDKIHSLASGNKYYKLKPNFEYAKQQGIKRLLSFGGAYSNHIHALALYANKMGFETIGIIRGETEYANNPTLQDVQQAGMKLEFVDRKEYRLRDDKNYLAKLQGKYPDTLILPEGGSGKLAVSGCRQLMQEINKNHKFDYITAACGTGATFSGLVCGLNKNQTAIGYAALRDKTLDERIGQFILDEGQTSDDYKIEEAAYGGFAKLNQNVLDLVLDWLHKTNILLDPIYTSKMVLCLMQQLKAGYFPKGASICMIHSGGLQGWRGMKCRVINLGGEKSWVIIENKLKQLI